MTVITEPQFIVRLDGRLDVESAEQLAAAAAEWEVAAGRVAILDLGWLEYLSSSGIRALITVAKTLQAKGARLELAGAQGMVKRVLDVCGISQVVTVHEYVEDAVAAAERGAGS
jgi:anti-sigma B factor antagonist